MTSFVRSLRLRGLITSRDWTLFIGTQKEAWKEHWVLCTSLSRVHGCHAEPVGTLLTTETYLCGEQQVPLQLPVWSSGAVGNAILTRVTWCAHLSSVWKILLLLSPLGPEPKLDCVLIWPLQNFMREEMSSSVVSSIITQVLQYTRWEFECNKYIQVYRLRKKNLN